MSHDFSSGSTTQNPLQVAGIVAGVDVAKLPRCQPPWAAERMGRPSCFPRPSAVTRSWLNVPEMKKVYELNCHKVGALEQKIDSGVTSI